MKRNLIAVTLAVLPVLAMADVTLYGDLKASLEGDSVSGQASQNKLQDNTSLLGFKGEEDLGSGLKSIWQVESRLYMGNSSTSSLGTRQTFVGLDDGALGRIRLGYVNNSLNDLYTVDQWQYGANIKNQGQPLSPSNYMTVSGANGLSVFTNSGDRLKNALRYDSAEFYGFSANLGYGLGENKSQLPHLDGSTSASDIASLGLDYQYQDLLSAHYAFQRESNPLNTLAYNADRAANKSLFEVDLTVWHCLVSGAYQISTGYDWVDDFSGDGGSVLTAAGVLAPNQATQINPVPSGLTPAAARLKASQEAFSLAYTWGAITPKITYAKGWNEQANGVVINESGYRQYIVGVDYALSRRTTAGVSYGNLLFDKNTAIAQGDNPGADASLKAVALTLAHSF
jgi:predicted porin